MVPSLIKQQVLKVSEVSGGWGRGSGRWVRPSHHLGGSDSPQTLGGLSHQRPRGLNLTEAEVWPGWLSPSFYCSYPDLQPFSIRWPVTVPSNPRAARSSPVHCEGPKGSQFSDCFLSPRCPTDALARPHTACQSRELSSFLPPTLWQRQTLLRSAEGRQPGLSLDLSRRPCFALSTGDRY